jgi:hypothetical protein
MPEPITDKLTAISAPFPGTGHTYECDYQEWCIRITFLSEAQALIRSMTTGDSELVDITIIQIRQGLFQVHWQEQDSTVVSSIQDYENGVVWTCATHSRSTLCRQGTFREVD